MAFELPAPKASIRRTESDLFYTPSHAFDHYPHHPLADIRWRRLLRWRWRQPRLADRNSLSLVWKGP